MCKYKDLYTIDFTGVDGYTDKYAEDIHIEMVSGDIRINIQ